MENLRQLPFVREMIVEAVESISGQISYREIISWINSNYSGINEKTIRAQIIVLTVNHESRVHYPEINTPRITRSDNVYDFLFRLRKGEGVVERYEVEKHGIWEVYQSSDNKLKIRRQIDNLTDKVFTPNDILVLPQKTVP